MQDYSNTSHTVYTMNTNDILSKNMAVECILIKAIDREEKSRGELFEAVLSLLLQQVIEIDRFRIICEKDNRFSAELLRIASKNAGAVAMTERLQEEGDKSGDLAEALLTLIQSQFNDIQIVRRDFTTF
ncbi:Uncharacterised protein [Serratia ficaria]|uniref:hypothetical protein n=1 Tax=Serratia ficaria TaxID=61651 RepID=UPI00217BB2E7|nr:hypothetical protein [Serratia ficaria]CAI1246219.1 Uncharacterised protein [Serratia ficaria]CAI2030597.1 Uncharacterised protein [Serratia ficaria]CAI2528228.1 Uncharacterised protein [Serratia ficaria]CAI2540231.1 Uncharacterised protein [Serratia ficaria]CAI2794191.1 Uncharacterised protein [Serratia ficaria]